MSREETANVATELHGNKLYHERARRALPILVRQARARQPITYERLAAELDMPNARNLNFPLGSIGNSLKQLAVEWGQRIPPIQCLVINKNTGLPGPGVAPFLEETKERFDRLPKAAQRQALSVIFAEVGAYEDWDKVLNAFGLKSLKYNVDVLLAAASEIRPAGESEDHRRLKEWARNHPVILGIAGSPRATLERRLPSGDCLDVSFETNASWIAVEIKSAKSPIQDVLRGMFQVVKYKATMAAELKVRGLQLEISVVLVHERALSSDLRAIANVLGVECIEVMRTNSGYLRKSTAF